MPVDYQKIKLLRTQCGLTQTAAANKAGLRSRQHWQNIESGKRSTITVQTLERIAKALGVDARDLLK